MISAACVLWIAHGLYDLLHLYYGQPSAVLWKSQLFVAINHDAPGLGALYRGQVWPVGGIGKPIAYWGPTRTQHAYQAQIDIRDDRVLCASPGTGYRIIPLADVPGLEDSEFGERLCQLRGFRSYDHMMASYRGHDDQLLFPSHRAPDVPAPQVPVAAELARGPESMRGWQKKMYVEEARFSVEIAGPKSVRLFHAFKDRLFVSVEPDYLHTWYWDVETVAPKKDLPKTPERELRTGKLPADFTEYFCVYRADKRDYLVTPTGKVYMAVPKGKTEVDVSAVWADPKRPIVGVVQDQANDAVYGWGFVTDSAALERFYVKLDPKPVAVPYTRTVPLWGDRSDAYLESYECARAYRKPADKK